MSTIISTDTRPANRFVVPDEFRESSGDLVILSSDGVEFRIHKLFLIVGSGVFRGMFDLPQPATTSSPSNLQPIPWSETAENITQLLYYLYPRPKPIPKSLRDVISFMRAAFKWDIEVAVSELRKELVHASYLAEDSLKVYAFCCEMDLAEEKEIAAKAAAHHDIWTSPLREEFQTMSAIDLLRLHHLGGNKKNRSRKGFAPYRPVKTSSSTPFTIPTIFCNPSADLIVRAKDGTEFRIHRVMLSEASTVLRQELASLPRNQARDADDCQLEVSVFNWDEPRDIILELLYHIYPVAKPTGQRSLSELLTLLAVALRWELESVVVGLRKDLVSPEIMSPANSIRIYSFACKFGLEEERKLASRKAIHTDIQNHAFKEDFYGMTAMQLRALVGLRDSRVKAATSIIDGWQIVAAGDIICTGCHTRRAGFGSLFKEELKAQIALDPMLDVIAQPDISARYELAVTVCSSCYSTRKPPSPINAKLVELQLKFMALPNSL